MLKKEQLHTVSAAIRNAEAHTSGEIRVCVARHCKADPLKAAYQKFVQLRMEETRLRNGVLIYVAPADHKAAIYADQGIEGSLEIPGFWNDVLEEMLSYFREKQIVKGICRAVTRTGQQLAAHYPISDNDVNELSDEVVIDG
ncbi:MAG: TPM domain-containing protein [Fermentimonas sp.]|jgi:uncharacterized membrane protein